MYGCPKPVSLDEALRRPRGGGRKERVAVVPETEVDEVVDSDAIRWDERQICLRVADQKVPAGHLSNSEQMMTESGLAIEGKMA